MKNGVILDDVKLDLEFDIFVEKVVASGFKVMKEKNKRFFLSKANQLVAD